MEGNTRLSDGQVRKHNARLLRVEGRADARRILEELGSDTGGVAIMADKMTHLSISLEGVKARAAQIIKQVMLSKGGECATPHDLLLKTVEPVDIIVVGNARQLRAACQNLSVQPFGCKAIASEIKALMARELIRRTRLMKAGPYELRFGERTLVMGIVNVSPDSFSEFGELFDFDTARERALEMAAAGVDIIDIGGESTRPGAEAVSLEEELRRTVPLIESLAPEVKVPLSIDTYKEGVARRALDAGAVIVNDISGLRLDPALALLVAERKVPVCLTHMQGEPRTMQLDPTYDEVIRDIADELAAHAESAIESGIEEGMIMVDPGIGFGKTVGHNLEIIRRIEEFRSLGFPVVLGTSRKSFIGKVLGVKEDRRLIGTAATVAFAISRGVDVVRVHDVEEMVQVARMSDAMAQGIGYEV
jgi:dihydropteroate synthase